MHNAYIQGSGLGVFGPDLSGLGTQFQEIRSFNFTTQRVESRQGYGSISLELQGSDLQEFNPSNPTKPGIKSRLGFSSTISEENEEEEEEENDEFDEEWEEYYQGVDFMIARSS